MSDQKSAAIPAQAPQAEQALLQTQALPTKLVTAESLHKELDKLLYIDILVEHINHWLVKHSNDEKQMSKIFENHIISACEKFLQRNLTKEEQVQFTQEVYETGDRY